MHLLRAPLQIELPNNEIGSYNYNAGETSGRANKRTRHQGSSSSSSGLPESCCPTVIDVIEPTHGKNRAGKLLFRLMKQRMILKF